MTSWLISENYLVVAPLVSRYADLGEFEKTGLPITKEDGEG